MLTEKYQKVSANYFCEVCNYTTVTKSNFTKHLATAKHCLLTDTNKKVSESIDQYVCSKCDKVYKSRVGLWGHNKKCSLSKDVSMSPPGIPVFTTEVVLALVSQNKELQNILIEQNQKFMEKMSLVSPQLKHQ